MLSNNMGFWYVASTPKDRGNKINKNNIFKCTLNLYETQSRLSCIGVEYY